MILQALCEYYDILNSDPEVSISKSGYSSAKVSFALVLSGDGQISNIVDLRSDDKNPKPRQMGVPLQESRAAGVSPYFLCENAKYVFGVEKLKENEFQKKFTGTKNKNNGKEPVVLENSGNDVIFISQRSQECFERFKALQHEILDTIQDPDAKAFLTFLDNWNPEDFLNQSKILEYQDDILTGGNFVFEYKGSFLHENAAILKAWERYFSQKQNENTTVMQCLVSGQCEPIARTHQKIKGVVGAQVSGASLVGFNNEAFCSYGKTQSFNSPIGDQSMFRYTTALNHLLASQKNRIRIADATVVFWAETTGGQCEDLVFSFFNPRDVEEDTEAEQPDTPSKIQDSEKRKEIEDILKKVRKGGFLQKEDLGADPETKFYILGLSPNNARLAIRFWYVDTFGGMIAKIAQHHLDMEIIKGDFGARHPSVFGLLKETIARNSEKSDVPPLLGGLLMRSILNRTPYPLQMYNAILNRVKVERSINHVKAGFIKAHLLRQSRAGLTDIQEELITMSLNEDNPNVPYRLGRLFAVLESVQRDTNKDMGSTIRSKYFSSAAATPAVVFPVLLKLAQHHIAKSDWGFKTNRSIEEILSEVDAFPEFMNLDDQGMFMLGYYHQRQAFFAKKKTTTTEEE